MKKTLSLILSALILASVMVSCGSGEKSSSDGAETKAVESGESGESTSAETTEAPRVSSVPDGLDFEGASFNTAYAPWQGYTYYFFADEENGDAMNDSIYARKRLVEEKLNVTLKTDSLKDLNDVPSKVKSSVLAGDDTYQQVMLHCISGVSDLSSGGYLYNWDDLPYADYTTEWWNQSQMDALRLGKRTYFGISDFMIPCPYAVFVNKDMIKNNGMDDPYQLVYDGAWTLDKTLSMAASVVSDVNGDGEMTIDDMYGMSGHDSSLYISFMTGAGQFITQKNSDGKTELAVNTPKMTDIIDKFAAKMGEKVFFMPKSYDAADNITLDTGRLLFELSSVADAVSMRDYTVDLGFLPFPKYDEAQENYYSLDWGGLCCIPSTIANPELVSAVNELLAFYSADTVIPAYYDVVLAGKLARDEDTLNMLDLLFDTICYEVGGNYFGFASGFTDLFFAIPRLPLTNGSSDFASWYAKNENAANNTIAKFYELLEANQG